MEAVRDRAFWCWAIGLFAAARVVAVFGQRVREFDDTGLYRSASFPLGSPRPWGYRITLELPSPGWIVALHVVAAVAGFGVLAFGIASQMASTGVGRLAGAAVLVLGVHSRVTSWDLALLTESLAISATCALIGIALLGRDDVRWRWAFVAVFGYWLMLRDAHAFLGVPVAATVVWRWRSSRLVAVAVCIAAGWSLVVGVANQEIEMMNARGNIAWLAPDGDLKWFVERDMPLTDSFDFTEGRDRYDAVKADAAFSEWLDEQGAAIWPKYLLAHPRELIAPLGDWSTLGPVTHTRPTTVFDAPLLPDRPAGVALPLGAAVVALAAVVRRSRDRRLLFPVLVIASAVPHQLFAYHAAPIEHQRHALLMTLGLILACWWVIAIALDVVTSRRGRVVGGDAGVRQLGAVVGDFGDSPGELGLAEPARTATGHDQRLDGPGVRGAGVRDRVRE